MKDAETARTGIRALTVTLLLVAVPLRAETIVMEAEHALGLRPNLEIHKTKGASGGLAIGTDEGGGGNHTWLGGMNSSLDIGTAEYPFHLKKGGTYIVWGLSWWSDKCGNSMLVAVDGKLQHAIGDGHGEDPVLREWHWCPSDPFELEAGDHVLNVMSKEDHVRVDQWFIAPQGIEPNGIMKGAVIPRRNGVKGGQLDVSLWRESEVIDAEGRIRLIAWIRRSEGKADRATLKIDPGEKGARVEPRAEIKVDLSKDTFLVPVPITVQYAKGSPRSEKRLRVRLNHGGVDLAQRRVIVTKPFRWWMLAPLHPDTDLDDHFKKGLAVDLKERHAERARPRADGKWRCPLGPKLHNPYGTIAPEQVLGDTTGAVAYFYTEVRSPRKQTLKAYVNNDDAARVYVNGRLLFEDDGGHPAEGYLGRAEVTLNEGINRVLVRLTQSGKMKPVTLEQSPNYWLFRLRIRKSDHKPAEIWGVER